MREFPRERSSDVPTGRCNRRKAGISPSNLTPTMQTRTPPLIWNCWQTELLAWDYTAEPDLTFSVFSQCKYPHRPTCSRLTPLFKEERADPMLSDPDLPMLPLSSANFATRPPLLSTSGASVRSFIQPPRCVGTYTCGAPDQLPAAPKTALLWRLQQQSLTHTHTHFYAW